MPACMLLGGLWGLRMPLQWHTFIRMLAQAPATPPPEESKASAARRAGLRRGPALQTHFHTAALPQWQQRCGRSSAAHPLQAGRWQMAEPLRLLNGLRGRRYKVRGADADSSRPQAAQYLP